MKTKCVIHTDEIQSYITKVKKETIMVEEMAQHFLVFAVQSLGLSSDSSTHNTNRASHKSTSEGSHTLLWYSYAGMLHLYTHT